MNPLKTILDRIQSLGSVQLIGNSSLSEAIGFNYRTSVKYCEQLEQLGCIRFESGRSAHKIYTLQYLSHEPLRSHVIQKMETESGGFLNGFAKSIASLVIGAIATGTGIDAQAVEEFTLQHSQQVASPVQLVDEMPDFDHINLITYKDLKIQDPKINKKPQNSILPTTPLEVAGEWVEKDSGIKCNFDQGEYGFPDCDEGTQLELEFDALTLVDDQIIPARKSEAIADKKRKRPKLKPDDPLLIGVGDRHANYWNSETKEFDPGYLEFTRSLFEYHSKDDQGIGKKWGRGIAKDKNVFHGQMQKWIAQGGIQNLYMYRNYKAYELYRSDVLARGKRGQMSNFLGESHDVAIAAIRDGQCPFVAIDRVTDRYWSIAGLGHRRSEPFRLSTPPKSAKTGLISKNSEEIKNVQTNQESLQSCSESGSSSGNSSRRTGSGTRCDRPMEDIAPGRSDVPDDRAIDPGSSILSVRDTSVRNCRSDVEDEPIKLGWVYENLDWLRNEFDPRKAYEPDEVEFHSRKLRNMLTRSKAFRHFLAGYMTKDGGSVQNVARYLINRVRALDFFAIQFAVMDFVKRG